MVVSPKWQRRVGCGAPQCSSLSSRGGAGSKCGLWGQWVLSTSLWEHCSMRRLLVGGRPGVPLYTSGTCSGLLGAARGEPDGPWVSVGVCGGRGRAGRGVGGVCSAGGERGGLGRASPVDTGLSVACLDWARRADGRPQTPPPPPPGTTTLRPAPPPPLSEPPPPPTATSYDQAPDPPGTSSPGLCPPDTAAKSLSDSTLTFLGVHYYSLGRSSTVWWY